MPSAHSSLADGMHHAMLFMVLHRFAGLACSLRPSPEQPCKPRWGVVQLVGHLTVNEDGEGSNPSAPANFLFKNIPVLSTLTSARQLADDTEMPLPKANGATDCSAAPAKVRQKVRIRNGSRTGNGRRCQTLRLAPGRRSNAQIGRAHV